MKRRDFVSTTSLAGSAAFVGLGSFITPDRHLAAAKILLEKEEFLHLKTFVTAFKRELHQMGGLPLFTPKLYEIKKLVERRNFTNGYEVKMENTAGDYLVLVKKEGKKAVKFLKKN